MRALAKGQRLFYAVLVTAFGGSASYRRLATYVLKRAPTQPQRGLTGLYRDVWFYRTRRLEPLENDLITSLNLTKTFLKVVLELPLDVLAMAPRYPTETPTYVLKRAACKLQTVRFSSPEELQTPSLEG